MFINDQYAISKQMTEFDANAPEAFVEHMKKLHARLANTKTELTKVVGPVNVRGER
jgi:hypothetical protein